MEVKDAVNVSFIKQLPENFADLAIGIYYIEKSDVNMQLNKCL